MVYIGFTGEGKRGLGSEPLGGISDNMVVPE
jgi:hypothetical protein